LAHTAVAATVYPLLVAINSLYSEDEEPTKFGKGLFICMAIVAGAGSIITLLGAAPNAIAYSSQQFKSSEFFMAGIPASIILMIVLSLFVCFIWPLMGMLS
jgi:di/tricarboxylate transporter